MKPDGSCGEIQPSRVVENSDEAGLVSAVLAAAAGLGAETGRILVASVNEPVADRLCEAVSTASGGARLVRLSAAGGKGGGLAIPMATTLEPPVTVGADRLLAALAAFDRSQEACVVIDAGTAVTVDFVDRMGVFQGGVIAPGLGAMLEAMHRTTAALPLLTPPRMGKEEVPAGPMGKTTAQAMMLGAVESIRGLAHRMIDRYAEAAMGYPRVVATGGDAPLLFEDDDLVEIIVPDLVLMGMHAAWARAQTNG